MKLTWDNGRNLHRLINEEGRIVGRIEWSYAQREWRAHAENVQAQNVYLGAFVSEELARASVERTVASPKSGTTIA